MVAFNVATQKPPSLPPRAPAQVRVGRFVTITCSVPNHSCDLYKADSPTDAQLVSSSRDPIGYLATFLNIYEYVRSDPSDSIDPTGTTVYDVVAGGAPVSPEAYAKSKCYCACASQRNLLAAMWPGPDAIASGIRTRSEAFANRYFLYGDRRNSALRHCIAGGLMAATVGCHCAQCLEDYRDVAQFYWENQSLTNTQQAIYNDREGRFCAGCWGKAGTRDPLWEWVGPITLGIATTWNAIESCCLRKVMSNQLHTGNPGTGIPLPTYPRIVPSTPPPNWTDPPPVIEWD